MMLQSNPDTKLGSTPKSLLSQLSTFVVNRFGLHFPENRWRNLERGILSAARELGFEDTTSCILWLSSSPLTRDQIEVLAAHLTIGETYFFRDKEVFNALREHIFPERIDSHHGQVESLRIWSAGCSTGEEPYSIAILLHQMMHGPGSVPESGSCAAHRRSSALKILATDVNARFLRKASEGLYGEWSFRGIAPKAKEAYFKKTKEGRYEILPIFKSMVNFGFLNLAEDFYPSFLNGTENMDVIFCRNVLMYFDQVRMKRVIQRLHSSLAEGGWLIVSPSETSSLFDPMFTRVNLPGVILYKKSCGKPWEKKEEIRLPKIETRLLPENAVPFTTPGSDSVSSRPIPKPVSGINPEPVSFQGIHSESVARGEMPDPEPDFYSEALTLYEKGCYTQVIENATAHLAQTQMKEKEPGCLKKVMVLLIRACANHGRLTEAVEWSQKATSLDKLDPELHFLHANVLQEQGRVDEAVLSFKRSLYIDPDWVPAHFALGHLMRRQGKVEESIRHFRNALSLLRSMKRDDIITEFEGMTVGRLMDLIMPMVGSKG